MRKHSIFMLSTLLVTIFLAGCSLTNNTNKPDITSENTKNDQITNPTPIPTTISRTASLKLTSTQKISQNTPIAEIPTQPQATQTAFSTMSPYPTITPTFAILRGKVIPERANCRYGPGAPYLYKYGLVGGSNLEIIGRNSMGTWLLVQAIGGDNPCWVKADLMDIKGEIVSLEPYPPEIIQAWSPYYPPLAAVSAVRNQDVVTVHWSPLYLKPGDDSGQVPYILEAWVCQDRRIIFLPVGSYQTTVQINDEPGCSEPSQGQVLAAEKHGYTRPAIINWPQAEP